MFRKVPAIEVVDQVLRSLKIGGVQEKRWFAKDEICIDTMEDWMPILEPYYLPCKAERYLRGEMTRSRAITVVRHLLKAHKIELKVQERMVNGHKTTLYQVFYNYIDPIVRFD